MQLETAEVPVRKVNAPNAGLPSVECTIDYEMETDWLEKWTMQLHRHGVMRGCMGLTFNNIHLTFNMWTKQGLTGSTGDPYELI
ncbi:hypothetical protein DPMN_040017 [Dreissena polymorpha]|uniref:Uncharacterized protein n=1 Tax=Dreissena polymorpha TaxID=45954 RepID=A0A9D4HWG5_DREPO|nr:hypothetical protein DPMN_040017 [Dreissena polymorpha]